MSRRAKESLLSACGLIPFAAAAAPYAALGWPCLWPSSERPSASQSCPVYC
jgi:hypothetical protein